MKVRVSREDLENALNANLQRLAYIRKPFDLANDWFPDFIEIEGEVVLQFPEFMKGPPPDVLIKPKKLLAPALYWIQGKYENNKDVGWYGLTYGLYSSAEQAKADISNFVSWPVLKNKDGYYEVEIDEEEIQKRIQEQELKIAANLAKYRAEKTPELFPAVPNKDGEVEG